MDGVKEGETIAVTQVSRLDTGTKVRVVTGDAKGAGAKRPG